MELRNNFQIYLATVSTLLLLGAQAASCNLKPSYSTPIVSNGWQAKLVANRLQSPRGILFDSKGNLLVVQQGVGIVHLAFDDGGSTCLDVSKKTNLITSSSVSGTKASEELLLISHQVKSWNCTLCRWQDSIRVRLQLCLLLVLRRLGGDSQRHESNVSYGHEQ
jgi:hypothetical protein